MCCVFFFFFFFKQKTAYEMRISDWSSDVCSSDLMRMVRVRCRGLLHGGAMILLRQGGRGDRRDEDAHERLHAASPSSGRTVTTRNIPACMWSSRWQWKAQSPGASAVRSKLTLPPGSTLTVCLRG